MGEVRTDEQNYIDIANAIREKNGSDETYKPREMAAAISNISGGGGSGLDIYSETETMIGYWTDGKPLYRKVVKYDISSISVTYFDLPFDMKTNLVKDIRGYWKDKDDESVGKFPLVFNMGTSNTFCSWYTNDVGIHVDVGGGWSRNNVKYAVIILEYTKTTDTAGQAQVIPPTLASVKAEVYSEQERVVGVWKDGKPIYRKTQTIDSVVVGNNTIDIKDLNVDDPIKVYGYAYVKETGNYLPLPYVNERIIDAQQRLMASPQEITLSVQNSTFVGEKAVITIEYTKTTDSEGMYPTNGTADLSVETAKKLETRIKAFEDTATNGLDYYSEEERIVGVWKNGKPLYQKTINCGMLPVNNTKTQSHNVKDIENVVEVYGCFIYNDTFRTLPYVTPVAQDVVVLTANKENVVLNTSSNGWGDSCPAIVNIRYTKTTDKAGTLPTKPVNVLGVLEQSTNKLEVNLPLSGSEQTYQNDALIGKEWIDVFVTRKDGLEHPFDTVMRVYGGIYNNKFNYVASGYQYPYRVAFDNKTGTVSYSASIAGDGVQGYMVDVERISAFYYPYTKAIEVNPTGQDNYSTDEVMIGTWIDGKPLYRRVFVSNSSISRSVNWVVLANNAYNIDTIVAKSGIYICNGAEYGLNDFMGSNENYTRLMVQGSEVRVLNQHNTITYVHVILEYTKTTD